MGKGRLVDLGHPARGLAFIRHIDTEERYQGGAIVIPEHIRDKVAKQQFNVVAVGLPALCEDYDDCSRRHRPVPDGKGGIGHRHHPPMELEAGDWVICRNRSWAATPDPNVFVVRQSDILGRFIEAE
jgi:hypothetical protein